MKDPFITLDTETTGLKHKEGDRVIEIGAIEFDGSLPTGRTFHMYINPGRRKVDPDAFAVHNISDEFLRDKPDMKSVMPLFLDFIGDLPLVIHNAPFDTGFLNNELELLKMEKLRNRIIDSLDIARRLYPMSRNNLDSLCQRFGIDKSQRTYHGALIDADLLGHVYVNMMGHNQLDLGDHPLRAANMSMAVEAMVSGGSSRPVRPVRPAIVPSEDEIALHAAFVDKNVKDPVWAKFF